MSNKNFKTTKKSKNISQVTKAFGHRPRALNVDSVIRRKARPLFHLAASLAKPVFVVPFSRPASCFDFLRKVKASKKVPVLVAVLALLIAFSGGMWAALSTSKSEADSQPEVLGAETTIPSAQNYRVSLEGTGVLGPVNSVPNDVLFNMTIGQLESYMAEKLKSPELKEAEVLADRKTKLKIYLDEKNSPLGGIVDILAELKHWKVVLAVSNSESSLGKRCYNNNCSGIGVEPGNALWRNYKNKAEWAKDLDKLLEKRYKDWTLEKMNGVYNYPGSKNWLFASKQILEDLQDRGIE